MKKVFQDKNKMECVFTDEGITFCDSRREIYYPFGALDSLELSLLGVMQAVCHAQVCCFSVPFKDRAEFKECYKMAREAMKTAPRAEAVVIDRTQQNSVDRNLPPEEQLKQYKAQFVQGKISKDQYDAMKRLLKN